ncbi:MAG TPA: bifunctional transaldolase/phosoglucose isomerase [Stellaceae bacterium]|nr:bifunctional transaldolase/phosoglucose isomerase [Stellaceae bacterium]
MNPLTSLQDFGQSLWLDFFRRNLVASGALQALIAEDGVRGVTSNPSIFEQAIGGSADYDDAIQAIERERDLDAGALYERIAVADMRMAADVLRPVYDATAHRDGFISIEVSPYLASDTAATIAEAQRLWQAIERDNLMIKVPATAAGLPAIRELIGKGINVNVTLLFSQTVYEAVAEAYLAGLEALVAAGGDASRTASVASFFVSRIDTAVDARLEEKLRQANRPAEQATLQGLLGKVAIANAKLAYRCYQQLFSGERWARLERAGARTQRLLWASTGTKNPRYSDVLYVEALIGADTVNTIPPATLEAFRQHGRPRAALAERIDEAQQVMAALDRVGISLDEITAGLTVDGVRLFADAADRLLGAVARKRAAVLVGGVDRQSVALPAPLESSVKAALDDWRRAGKVRRLWRLDSGLWTGTNESQWLGWLGICDDALAHLAPLEALARDARSEGFTHVVLLGMGGSSLGPEVLGKTLGSAPGFPVLHVLDSTDPAQIRTIERRIELARTLFIVSSKSGTTLEPDILKRYFLARIVPIFGRAAAAKRFIAITDPGSALAQAAERDGFRHICYGVPSIGGRYSVLSNFGIVPAAVIGADIARLLDTAEAMVHSCASSVPPDDNPGVRLGLVLGTLARAGRDKVTIVASPGIADFGAWLEQLIAESTGKDGRGLIPIDDEPLGPPEVYGDDRLFAYLRLDDGADRQQDEAMERLAQAGHPVVRLAVIDRYHIGQEFFRWEMAVAVAGSVLGINPFDQPDVEASKIKTRELTAAFEKSGKLPPERPILAADGITLFADPGNARALAASGAGNSLARYLKAHLGRIGSGDYCALLAYIERSEAHQETLQAIRRTIRDSRHIATCLGFGPRFLHSTGQAYKGGPNSGVFLQITCDDADDLSIPGMKAVFGVVKAAQARGDFDVLAERGRRALRVHLGRDIAAGLTALAAAVEHALA